MIYFLYGDNMIDLKSIVYERNHNSFTISIDNEIKIKYNEISKTVNDKLFFHYLNFLYRIIDDWQKEYIDIKNIDGDDWKLTITYTNGNIKEYYGNASFPYNFEAFERLNQEFIEEVYHG